MIKIDGNYLEGGGQIVRNALALSALSNKEIEVENIRKGRSKPGLKAQHLKCVEALKELTKAETNEVKLGSEKLSFKPQELKAKDLEIDIGTAGSISLLLQSLILPLSFATKKSSIKIKGGTDTSNAIPFDYLKEVYLPHMRKYVKNIDLRLMKRGFYPKGGGEVELDISPKYKLKDYPAFKDMLSHIRIENEKINLTQRGELAQIRGKVYASSDLQDKRIGERIADSAKQSLKKVGVHLSIEPEYSNTLSTGCGICLYAMHTNNHGEIDPHNPVIMGADILGEKRISSEELGKKAANKLIEQLEGDSPVDKNLADNLVPWLIFGGQFKARELTNHTKTNVWTTNHFLEKSKIEIKKDMVYCSYSD